MHFSTEKESLSVKTFAAAPGGSKQTAMETPGESLPAALAENP